MFYTHTQNSSKPGLDPLRGMHDLDVNAGVDHGGVVGDVLDGHHHRLSLQRTVATDSSGLIKTLRQFPTQYPPKYQTPQKVVSIQKSCVHPKKSCGYPKKEVIF